jgi:protein-tyrosine-phosphatase
MKVLFVCRGNVGRSQAAMALWNVDADEPASSAGTVVGEETRTVGERELASSIVQVMQDEGLDISKNNSTQITSEMIKNFDKVIVMAEAYSIPGWLKDNPKTELWEVPDLKAVSLNEARSTVSLIKTKLDELRQST